MDPLNVQMIIDGCLVNNQKAREYLFHHLYTTGLPVAGQFTSDDETADLILENAYFHLLSNLPFYDASRLGFKSWARQVVTDMSIAASGDSRRIVYVLQALEGFKEEDISRRMGIPVAEVRQLFAEAALNPPQAAATNGHDASRRSSIWSRIEPRLAASFSSDEVASMPARARARQWVTQGGWIGWSILIALSATALMTLHFTGILPGKTFQTSPPPVTHYAMGLGYALPCPNH